MPEPVNKSEYEFGRFEGKITQGFEGIEKTLSDIKSELFMIRDRMHQKVNLADFVRLVDAVDQLKEFRSRIKAMVPIISVITATVGTIVVDVVKKNIGI